MKKLLGIVFLSLVLCTSAFSKSLEGQGSIKFNEIALNGFIKYLSTGIHNKTEGSSRSGRGITFAVSVSGRMAGYLYCPVGKNCRQRNAIGAIKQCRKGVKKYLKIREKCYVFAHGRKIVWNNEMFQIPSKASRENIIKILNDLNFYGSKISSTTNTNTSKTNKKVVNKYELKGERSIALSWDGYEDLIAGTVEFNEADYKGTLNLPLPNNDGTCDGTYSLQEGGKGTWQIACTNNMGAAGTLKWTEAGGVTGSGRDHNDKKVKFTVSKKS
tara:strand:- start:1393 stop:2205 length:813 start_codon:yes stop_codon:yes gene_type:complete